MSEPAAADLSNWRTHPFSPWAFHHIENLLPVAEIAAAPGQPMALPAAPRSLADFRLETADGPLDFAGFLRTTDTDGMVILLDGQLVHESYANGNGAHRRHILMSATKSLVGLVVGILADAGRLKLDAPVTDYVPEVAGTVFDGASLRQLLDMRTGVKFDPDQQRAYERATHWEPPGGPQADLHRFFAGLGPGQAVHGGAFAYVSANTDLLGWAIERATGQSFAELASALLWRPMGAEDDACITTDGHGAPRCTGGFCATVRDLARVGQLMVEGGARDDVSIIPPAWIEDIAANGDTEAWRTGEFAPGFSWMKMRYRGGWYVIDDEPQTLFAMGIHGQNLFVDRANWLVIAKLSSLNSPIDYHALPLTHRAVNEIRRCLLG